MGILWSPGAWEVPDSPGGVPPWVVLHSQVRPGGLVEIGDSPGCLPRGGGRGGGHTGITTQPTHEPTHLPSLRCFFAGGAVCHPLLAAAPGLAALAFAFLLALALPFLASGTGPFLGNDFIRLGTVSSGSGGQV